MTGSDPINDPKRLAALRELELLDAPQQEQFARLSRLARQLLGVPVSLVSLVDQTRQVHASQVGLFADEAGHSELPIANSFCANVVQTGKPLIVEDARQHPAVQDNPSIDEYAVIAYAGLPLRLPDGQILGAFCAIDHQPRHWTTDQLQILRDLTHVATTLLQQRRDDPGASELS